MAPDMDCFTPVNLMEGYLKKPKKWSKRYFVIREGPPPCLEYYDSHRRKSSGGKPKKVIRLTDAWHIGKKLSAKQKHLIVIYTEKEYFCMAADNETSQTNWVNSMRQAVMNYNKALAAPFPSMYKHIWHGHVDTKDLKDCDAQKKITLQGLHRCCLTDKTMVFLPADTYGGCNVEVQNHVEITIASVRACGRKDNIFFIEPGRASGIGSGKLKFELDDYTIAESMHMTILDIWNLSRPSENPRTRTYSGQRPANYHRSRQNYCPPPRHVGLNKPIISNGSKKDSENRSPSGSYIPARLVWDDENSRDRASSEGAAGMKFFRYRGEMEMRHHPLSHKNGWKSRPHGSSSSAVSAPHSRTSSLSGSGRNSPDQYIHHSIPPPPVDAPASLPIHLQSQKSEVRQSHSRNHSFDGNSSISASSLSSSPYMGNETVVGIYPAQDEGYIPEIPPSKETIVNAGEPVTLSSDYEPMSFPFQSQELESQEYTLMTPGRLIAPLEDGGGYVPMCSLLKRSQPQEIGSSRHLMTERILHGPPFPTSPNRSPDKHHHNHKNFSNCNGSFDGIFPHNFPQTAKHSPNESVVYSNSYAFMADVPLCSSNELSLNRSLTDTEYVPMKAMTSSMFRNNVPVVGNVIAVAESSREKPNVPQVIPRRYPHEMPSTSERTTAPRRRYTVSSGISLHLPRNVRMNKYGRRGSTRSDSKSSDSSPPNTPGGEYVSIDYNRARKQLVGDYISLTEPEFDSEWSHSEDFNNTPKKTHDSNGNILPNLESTTKDEN